MSVSQRIKHLVLIGPSGVGKSLIATKLSNCTELPRCDLDNDICEHAGVDIAWIFDKEGEAGFRNRELTALRRAINNKPSIISTGAGIVTTLECYRLLQDKTLWVVYLSASVELLYQRLHNATNRPMLDGMCDRQTAIQQMLQQRKPLYQELADMEIACDYMPAQTIVNKLIDYVPVNT